MLSYDEVEDLGARRICWKCVGDPYLHGFIKQGGSKHECSYCSKNRRTRALSEIGTLISAGIEGHYESVVEERGGDELELIVGEKARVEDHLAKDLIDWIREDTYDRSAAEIGEPQPFDEDLYWVEGEVRDGELNEAWKTFENSFRTESRFFSRAAEKMFKTIFDRLSELRAREGDPVIVEAGPGLPIDQLVRGRVFFNKEAVDQALMRPHLHIGPPPAKLAIAGRMNPPGIAVFYGATTLETVLCETRPPVGSFVVAANFNLLRTLRLLDVSAFRKVLAHGSIFDPAYLALRQRAAFLNRLASIISRPVMPGDEPLEYLSTQAMAEYFSEVHEPQLDGMIYGSPQAGGHARNVVLFHHAAKLEEFNVPEGTEMDVIQQWEDDGSNDPSTTYVVMETPAKEVPNAASTVVFDDDFDIDRMPRTRRDTRTPVLSLDMKSVSVCSIDGMTPDFTEHSVVRQLMEPGEPQF